MKRPGAAWQRRSREGWDRGRLRRLKVAELFASVQGEGSRAGWPTVFVRLTGCALRCRWCDTSFAFTEGSWWSLEELVNRIVSHRLPRVCLTGGEPLLQPSVLPLARHLSADEGLDVVVETGGDQDISVVPEGVGVVMDIKLPGSGMAARFDRANLGRLRAGDEVKMIVADRTDYEQARRIVEEELRGFRGPILLGAVHGGLDAGRLAEWVLEDRLPVRVQLQLHKLLWPGRERGV